LACEKDGRLIWADTLQVGEEVFPHLKRRALPGNCKAIATLLYFDPEIHKRLELLRDSSGSLDCLCAATSVSGLIVFRLASDTSSNLKLALRDLIDQLGPEFGSGSFRAKKWSPEANIHLRLS
jgi:urease accessory protein UreH